MPIKILIADDDATIRLLLRRLLEKQPDWEVCGDAINGLEAIERVEQLDPDVVGMDLGMPVMTALQAAPEIAKTHPHPTAEVLIPFHRKLLIGRANFALRGNPNHGTRVVEGLIRNEFNAPSSGMRLAT